MNYQYRDSYIVYFGDRQEALSLQEIKESRYSLMLQNIVQDHDLDALIVLDQIHAPTGLCIEDMSRQHCSSWFENTGDFLVTNQQNVALVVLTADCIPLVMYDPVNHAVALVHAGWKGAYLGVVPSALQIMQQKYGTQPQDLICTFGPSARACCYEVSTDFIRDFESKYPGMVTFVQRGSRWYFDNSLFLQQILKNFGIITQNIYVSSALCTICNVKFCSFRREKDSAGRQVTMVALR